MAGVNKVILVGRLGKDPEVRTLPDGAKVASFSLATSETYNDKKTGERKEITEWHNITMWRGLAELAEKYLNKGSQIYLEGKLQTRSYEKDGSTRYSTDIVANNMQFLGGKNDGGAPQQGQAASAPVSQAAPAMTASIDDAKDDLPF